MNILILVSVDIRFGNILRFPRAAVEPPRASHCGVSSRLLLPQESPYISYAKRQCSLFFENINQLCASSLRYKGM